MAQVFPATVASVPPGRWLHQPALLVDRPEGPHPNSLPGWWVAFRSVESFVGRASWINTTNAFKDAWFCLSLQSKVTPNARNPAKPKAERKAANALAVKALWIDADVGPRGRIRHAAGRHQGADPVP